MSIRRGESIIAGIPEVDDALSDSSKHPVQNKVIKAAIDGIFSSLYPVGSLYIGTQNTCPLATLIPGSIWTLVSSGQALWTGNGTSGSGATTNANFANAPANTTIEAGLPNITGTWNSNLAYYGGNSSSGALYATGATGAEAGVHSASYSAEVGLDASRSSAIYGKSATVQPPAYVVNVWRRDPDPV